MKKFTSFLLTFVILISLLSSCNNSPVDSDNPQITSDSTSLATDIQLESIQPNPESDFEYEINDDGGITITRYIGESGNVIIPDTVQGKPVTQIGIHAFVTQNTIVQYPSNDVFSIQMPNTITVINFGAFKMCEKLEKITLSDNLVTIGGSAFEGCPKLKHITISSKVRTIADQAFDSSGLETVTFEEGIEVIGGYGAFACTQLKQITLPSSIREIGTSTFAGCPNLESVVLNEGLVEIGHKAFVNNPKLKEIIIPKTVKFVTEMDFNMCSSLEKIMFEGNAPDSFEYSDSIAGVWEPYDVHFTIYYHEGAEGFTSPEWYGYPTQTW